MHLLFYCDYANEQKLVALCDPQQERIHVVRSSAVAVQSSHADIISDNVLGVSGSQGGDFASSMSGLGPRSFTELVQRAKMAEVC